MSSNGESVELPTNDEPDRVDPSRTVVVATGGGTRFHRPDGLGFDVACKTTFGRPTRAVTVAEARDEGFTPCEKAGCFGGR